MVVFYFIYICFFIVVLLNKYISFFLFLALLGCDKTKLKSSANAQDSVEYYIKKAQKLKGFKDKNDIYREKIFPLIESQPTSTNKEKKIDEFISKVFALNNQKLFDKASKLLISEAKKLKDTFYLAKAHRYRGTYFYSTTVLDSAFTHFVESEKLYLKLNDKTNYAIILYKKGYLQIDIADYYGADVSLRKAYYIFKELDDKNRLALVCNSLGIVSNQLDDFKRAKDYYEEALNIILDNKIENVDDLKYFLYNNLGVLYKEEKNYSKALYYLNESLNNNNLYAKDRYVYSSTINNIGMIYLEKKDYKTSLFLLKKALHIRDSLKSVPHQILSYNNLSEYYSVLRDTTTAIEFSNKAIKLAKETKVPQDIVSSLQQASLVDKKNASRFSKEYIRINDSLRAAERKNIDRFNRIQLETDAITQEKDNFREQANYLSKTLMIFFIIGIILFLIFSLRSRNRQLRLVALQQEQSEKTYKLIMQQQDQINEVKNTERSRIAREIHDGVLGRIFGLRINLDSIKTRSDQDAVNKRLEYFDELKKIEQHLREISHELSKENQDIIDNYQSIINSLLQDQKKINKAKIIFNTETGIDWDDLSSLSKINLFRILQESLQNINKYANAKNIKIQFYKEENTNLVLKIIDDGIGFDLQKMPNGIGLKNMIARAQESQGTFEIQSEKGKGTQILVKLPFKKRNA